MQAWRGVALTGAAAITAMLFVGVSPSSADSALVARWELNESASASVMADSGPLDLDGAIGDEIVTGGGSYVWSVVDPTGYPATDERLVIVPDAAALNPGLDNFEIEMRYRSAGNYGNIVQKGQNGSPTGFWKFEHPWGRPSCAFKDDTGLLKAVIGDIETNDGQWHVIRCELDRDFGDHGIIRVFVDGAIDKVNVLKEPLGPIANDRPLALGGKAQCNQMSVFCDYFWGEIDYIEIRSGASSAPPTSSTTTTTVASGGPPLPGGIFVGGTVDTPAVRGARTALD